MNILIVVLSVIAAASAGHLGGVLVGPGTHGSVIQGPSAHASLVGPDGSHVAGVAHGGAVVVPPQHGGSIAASVTPGHIAYTAPVYAHHGYAHQVAHQVAHHVAVPVVAAGATVLSGPAGTVTTHGSHATIAGPASTTYAHGYGAVSVGDVAHSVYSGLHAGDGHEGQYVPSGLEKLYDDGSYKGEHYYGHDDVHHYGYWH